MQNAWNWLNGNKTVFGLILVWLADRVWFQGAVGQAGVDIAQYAGGLLTGVGVIHKISKATTTPEPNL